VTFTDEVKQELARLPLGDEAESRTELAALARFAGALVLAGGGRGLWLDLETVSGATARRAFALVQRRYGVAPELRVRAPGGVQRRRLYGVRLERGGAAIAGDLGLLDGEGRPLPPAPVPTSHAGSALRGAFLAGGSISAPDRAPHLEVVAHNAAAAGWLAGLARDLTDGHLGVVTDAGGGDDRVRVVAKSGATIGDLLAAAGASNAFLRWDERRLRRQLRGAATRLANADAANLRRTVEAASSQVGAVEEVVAAVGWDELDTDLRGVAIARLANPQASLAELGQLADPPLSKTAVHRRLRRLEALASELRERASETPPG
jgi:cell division protein WhiA